MEDYYVIGEKDFDVNFIEIIGNKREQCLVLNKKEFFESVVDKNINYLFNVDFDRCNIYIDGEKCENINDFDFMFDYSCSDEIKALFTQRVYFLPYKLYYQKINCDKKIYHIGELLNGSLNSRRIHNYYDTRSQCFETKKILQVFHFEDDEQVFDYLLKITINVDFLSEFVVLTFETI